ncbi:MAG: hypothetical protein JF588_14120 [Caulobacterales bacterium]|nr:hypothetical protein [Caulobacterales bacterium]
MRTVVLALVGASLLGAGAAQAAPTAANPTARASAAAAADGRCILVMNLLARDPKNRDAATRGTFYYLGRLAARSQTGDLTAILVASGKSLSGQAQLQSELKRCGGDLNASGGKLGAAFQQLQQMGPAAPAGPAPAAAPTPAPGQPAPLFPPPAPK